MKLLKKQSIFHLSFFIFHFQIENETARPPRNAECAKGYKTRCLLLCASSFRRNPAQVSQHQSWMNKVIARFVSLANSAVLGGLAVSFPMENEK
jgi:hypothetical protein